MPEHAEPAQPRVLRLLPGRSAAPGTVPPGTDPAPGTVPGVEPGAVPVLVPPGAEVVPMTVPERAAIAVRHWSRDTALELWLHPGRLLYSLYHGRPDSLAGHRAYVKSRAWVPRELEGTKAGKVIAVAGVAHHVTIGRLCKTTGKFLESIGDRAIRFYGVLILLIILIFVIF